jgi:hypothetical protein
MALNKNPSVQESGSAVKLRLNAEQWQTLESLANEAGTGSDNGRIAMTRRLTSNGLVATDQKGLHVLNHCGLHRLSQGR